MNPRPREAKPSDAEICNEVQIVLAEKRTSLSVLRTGIGIFALPLGVLSLLVTTSRYYRVNDVIHWLAPLLLLCALLTALGTWLTVRALHRIRRFNLLIEKLKRGHSRLAELLE
jgi:uncharacterized membrane protein YidH (DUF202 family)